MNIFLILPLLLALCCHAHLTLKYPIPLGSPNNPYSSIRDWSLTNPLNGYLAFPCKQYHKSASHGAQHSVAIWPAGSTQNFTLEGAAWHSGGSCQLSLSYDGGKRWKVIKSFMGSCPSGPPNERPEFASASFTVPEEAGPGEALFAWTWFNRMGNREMYMSCAVVTITRPGSAPLLKEPRISKVYDDSSDMVSATTIQPASSDICEWDITKAFSYPYSLPHEYHHHHSLAPGIPFIPNYQTSKSSTPNSHHHHHTHTHLSMKSGLESFPDILVAQLPGLTNCYIPEGEQVEFPNPGRDVQRAKGVLIAFPRGECAYPLFD